MKAERDWDQCYQDNDTPWDRGEPAPPLVEYMESNSLKGNVLVPGCGLGHDTRFLASKGCDVTGVDLSTLAIQKANASPAPVNGSLTYRLTDFLDPDNGLENERFDCVFEHTCFCAIDPVRRIDYEKAVRRVLKPGGQFLAILFTHLDDPDGPPFPTKPEEVEKLFGNHFEILRNWKPSKVFEGRENEESMYLMKRR